MKSKLIADKNIKLITTLKSLYVLRNSFARAQREIADKPSAISCRKFQLRDRIEVTCNQERCSRAPQNFTTVTSSVTGLMNVSKNYWLDSRRANVLASICDSFGIISIFWIRLSRRGGHFNYYFSCKKRSWICVCKHFDIFVDTVTGFDAL